jgi:hypothetical protein
VKKVLRSIAMFTLSLVCSLEAASQQSIITAVGPVGVTVYDMDRSLDFYTHVLHFSKLSAEEFAGESVEHVKGVFGARIRVARLHLGEEQIELTQYLAPQGPPVPMEQMKVDGLVVNEFMVKDPDGHAVLLQSPAAASASASR